MPLRALLAAVALGILAILAAPDASTHASSPAGAGSGDVWGNLDCMGGLTPADAIVILADVARVDSGQDQNCPPIGAPVSFNGGPGVPFGDINCSGTADIGDTLAILGNLAGTNVSSAGGCTSLGAEVLRVALGEPFTPADTWRDFGDAPDGTPTGYTAGAVTGHFATLAASGGPTHFVPQGVGLGEQVTSEDVPNADDAGDDGLLYSDLHSCGDSSLLLLLNLAGLTTQQKAQPVYVNVFADWDQDGTWTGTSGCASEAAVVNQPIDVSESGDIEVVNVDFTAGQLPAQFWMRVIVTTQPYTPGDQDIQGETEDYLVASNNPLPASTTEGIAQPQYDKDKAGKEFVCKGGWVPHGNGDMTIDIEQTQDSKTGGFRPKNPRLNFGPVMDLLEQNVQGVQITKVGIDASTLNDGRVRYRIKLSITSQHDAPNRLQGPLYTEIKITGTDQKNQAFKGTIICGFYIDHSDKAQEYNPDTDGFQGGPGHGGTGPGLAPQQFYVIEHGKKPTVFSDSAVPNDQKNGSVPDKKSITVFGPDGAQLDPKDYKAKAGISDLKTGDKGRGVIISTVEDKRDDPVQSILIRVDGKAPDGTTTFRDFYRVIIVHEKGDKKKKLIDDLNLYYVSNPVYPGDYAFAINYVSNGDAFVEKTVDVGGLTFDPATICTVGTAGDSILSPVAGELAFVLQYPTGATDLMEFDRFSLTDDTKCEDATNLTNYGSGSPFAVEHPTWCWGGGYGFTELNRQAGTFRQAFVPEGSLFPFPLPGGDGYRNSTCFRFPAPEPIEPLAVPSGEPVLHIGLTARKPDADGHGSDVWYVPYDCSTSCAEGASLPNTPKLLIDVSGNNVHALGPVVSRDGTKIAWAKATLNDDATQFVDSQIWVGDFDGATLTVTNERQLTTEGLNIHPQWSPNSNLIIFDSNRDGNAEIYVMNANGENQTNLSNTPNAAETQPSWETP